MQGERESDAGRKTAMAVWAVWAVWAVCYIGCVLHWVCVTLSVCVLHWVCMAVCSILLHAIPKVEKWYFEVWNEPNCCGGYPDTGCCGPDCGNQSM
jgi:hypothetical protein